MDKNPLNKGVIAENFAGLGTVTSAMVQERARELAQIAGRLPSQSSSADYEMAKRELTGEPALDPQEAMLESMPDADSPPGFSGSRLPISASEDEDDEGRNESQQLVEEGVKEAEQDQMLQAARAAGESDREEQ